MMVDSQEDREMDARSTLREEKKPILGGIGKDENRRKKWITFTLCLSFLSLGSSIAIVGPTLLSLEESLHTTLPRISLVFTVRSLAALVGATLAGALADRVNPLLTIGICLMVFGICTIASPFLPSVVTLAVVCCFIGLSVGIIDTSANLKCLRVWGRKRAPVMLQVLHFNIAIGSVIAPLVAAPFLKPINTHGAPIVTTTWLGDSTGNTTVIYELMNITLKTSVDPENLLSPGNASNDIGDRNRHRMMKRHSDVANASVESTHLETPIAMGTGVTLTPMPVTKIEANQGRLETSSEYQDTSIYSYSVPSTVFAESLTDGDTSPIVNSSLGREKDGPLFQDDRFEMSYVIMGVIAIIISMTCFFCLHALPKDGELVTVDKDQLENHDTNTLTYRNRILALLFAFNILYVGGEVAYGGYVATFAVECDLHFNKEQASNVTAVFWCAFAIGRGLSIGIATVVSPLKMVIADIAGCLVATVLLSCFAEKYGLVLWIGSALLGLSMASFFPSSIAWLQCHMTVTGRAASVLVVGSSLGQMLAPFVIGFLMDPESGLSVGPIILMYAMLGASVLASLSFFYAVWLASRVDHKEETQTRDDSSTTEHLCKDGEVLHMENIGFQEDGGE